MEDKPTLGQTIMQWCAAVPCSRSFAYKEIDRGNLKTIKLGQNNIITPEFHQEWLDKKLAEAEERVKLKRAQA